MKKYLHFKEIDSTQTYLKKNYDKVDNLTFVSSDYQSQGRGRLNRIWDSKTKENLTFSFVIKDHYLVKNFSSLSLICGVSIFNYLTIKLNIKNVSLKWPNDVYINDKKVCGILLEGVTLSSHLDGVIIGIGLNVNQDEFSEYSLKATSLKIETKKKHSVFFIKIGIYHEIKYQLKLYQAGKSDYLTVIRKNNYLLNKLVNAEINNEIKSVKVLDINEDNTLKVLVDEEIKNLSTGEITFHVEGGNHD